MDHDEPASAPGVISRRRLLAAGVLAGTAASLAACGSSPSPTGAVAPGTGPSASPRLVPSASAAATAVTSAPAPSLPPDRDTSMRVENRLPGDRSWDLRRARTGVEAYLGLASAAPGGPLDLRVKGTGTADVEWYRLGWYGGTGGRLLRVDHGVPLRSQPKATIDRTTGLVEARWTPVLHTTAPTGVKSGMVLAVVRQGGRAVADAPIILRPDPTDTVRAPVLFVSAACTWQAYNDWGGYDLYGAPHTVPATNGLRAAAVSFDRPHRDDGGAGYLRRWELQFIRWMERSGRDVEYIADIDLQLHPELVDGRRLLVMAGHPEYWSRPMRERVEAAVAAGTHVAFLTGNEVYWQTRIEDGPAGPASRIVCYKSARADPLAATQPALTTCRWREAPVSDPEGSLIGEMYGHVVKNVVDWVVGSSGHWLYEGTGLSDGDHISNLVGQEYDTFDPAAPWVQPGTVVLADSPVEPDLKHPADPGVGPASTRHNATVYTAASGATVVAAGTFQWSWAIDAYGDRSYHGVHTPVDARVARMTRNLFDRLGDGPLLP